MIDPLNLSMFVIDPASVIDARSALAVPMTDTLTASVSVKRANHIGAFLKVAKLGRRRQDRFIMMTCRKNEDNWRSTGALPRAPARASPWWIADPPDLAAFTQRGTAKGSETSAIGPEPRA